MRRGSFFHRVQALDLALIPRILNSRCFGDVVADAHTTAGEMEIVAERTALRISRSCVMDGCAAAVRRANSFAPKQPRAIRSPYVCVGCLNCCSSVRKTVGIVGIFVAVQSNERHCNDSQLGCCR
ncbi:hypothetical protein QAD02_024235 [Eretmocerus hayati]|uniref:Uncharacterized protein n=1 Tax=Eretmocerus hayati TaxID=131215 RepID=A0ACC2Q2Z4_9HYME|nr:hypothetical protein QAD02_024235 [Eretmocerus hayati]